MAIRFSPSRSRNVLDVVLDGRVIGHIDREGSLHVRRSLLLHLGEYVELSAEDLAVLAKRARDLKAHIPGSDI